MSIKSIFLSLMLAINIAFGTKAIFEISDPYVFLSLVSSPKMVVVMGVPLDLKFSTLIMQLESIESRFPLVPFAWAFENDIAAALPKYPSFKNLMVGVFEYGKMVKGIQGPLSTSSLSAQLAAIIG